MLEDGFSVVSTDASDKMLKYALKERWNRRKEPEFDDWGEWSEKEIKIMQRNRRQ